MIRLNGRQVPGFALGDSSSAILQPGWRYLGTVQTPRGWTPEQINKLLEQNGWTDEATGAEPGLTADGLSLRFTISAVWNGGIEPIPMQVDPFTRDVIYVPPFEAWNPSKANGQAGAGRLGEPNSIRQVVWERGGGSLAVGGVVGAAIGYVVSTPSNRWSPIGPIAIGGTLGGVIALSAVYLYTTLHKSIGEQSTHIYKGFTIKITCNALGSSDCVAGWDIKIGDVQYSDQVTGQTNQSAALSAAQTKIDAYLPGTVPGS